MGVVSLKQKETWNASTNRTATSKDPDSGFPVGSPCEGILSSQLVELAIDGFDRASGKILLDAFVERPTIHAVSLVNGLCGTLNVDVGMREADYK
jgi:hypothetical protein